MNNNNNIRTNRIKRRTKGEEVRVGDRVEVLNSYRGLKETRGVVVKVTGSQATINPDNDGPNFRKYKRNLKIVYDHLE